jgi:hypothetical protein
MSRSLLSYLFLKIDDQELVDKGDVVPGMVTMPDRQKDEGPGLSSMWEKVFIIICHWKSLCLTLVLNLRNTAK